MRQTKFVGASGLMDACAAGTVKLQVLTGDPDRWSVAPLSPISRAESEAGISAFYVAIGPTLLLIAGIFALTAFMLKKNKLRQERLGSEGVILHAELIKARAETGDDTPNNIRCEYRFTTPRGAVLTGLTSGLRRDLKKKDFPPPGTPMLVLYVDDRLFDAL
jgi:hypothetical protein